MEFEYVRHLYRTLRQVGFLVKYKQNEAKRRGQNAPDQEFHNQTVYKTTERAEELAQTVRD